MTNRTAPSNKSPDTGCDSSQEPAGERFAVVARRPQDAPSAIAKLGWRYHHLGIPHDAPRSGERHVEALGIHITGFETSPYGIEWMRFDAACEVPEIIRTVPHVAFEVDNLDEALSGREVLIAPNSPSPGVRVAFIVHDGAPIELLEFCESGGSKPEKT